MAQRRQDNDRAPSTAPPPSLPPVTALCSAASPTLAAREARARDVQLLKYLGAGTSVD